MSLVSDFRRCYSALFVLLLASVHATGAHAAASVVQSGVVTEHAERFARASGLSALADDEMAGVVAQAGSLFVADKITPKELGDDPFANFTYYRMGMDVKLDMNLNIAKLQLGCGGVNDLLTGPGCDLDIDYLSFMGINATGDRPAASGPDSKFQMTRPYIELAIKNDGQPNREIVGFKIGAERVNGALSFGREYTASTANLEKGGTCNPSATVGVGVLNCHSGINSISGFLSLEMSAGFNARANIAGFIETDLRGCLGRMTPSFGSCNSGTRPFFVEAGGTRLDVLHAAAAKLLVDNIDLNCQWWNLAVCYPAQLVANAIVDEGYGQLIVDTRLLHFLTVPNTENFFISFQREPVAYPNYSKNVPPSNIPFDACYAAYAPVPARCSSRYAPPANTGWWLNAPGAKLLNIAPPDKINVGNVSLSTVVSLLGPEGRLIIENPKLGMSPTDNCYGAASFC